MANRLNLLPDRFVVALIAAVVLASLLPVRGPMAGVLEVVTDVAIALLFFLHGARLSREAVIAGMGHWRLHLVVLASTFVMFPLIGVGLRAALPAGLVDPTVTAGLLYLCLLPSTVQSSIALTGLARGNVAAAVCAASASNLIGIVVTPLLVSVLLADYATGQGGLQWGQVQAIALQLLLPFVLGHLSRPLTAGWIGRHKPLVIMVDRGSILLVVYTAFSASVVEGLWGRLAPTDVAAILGLSAVILAVVLGVTTWGARALGFSKADEITIVFCGSKKSLASGVPMAGVLFSAATVGLLLVPVMIFHQLQLMVCAYLARRYAARPEETA